MNHEGKAFKYLIDKFFKLNTAEVKESIFVVLQIQQLKKYLMFD